VRSLSHPAMTAAAMSASAAVIAASLAAASASEVADMAIGSCSAVSEAESSEASVAATVAAANALAMSMPSATGLLTATVVTEVAAVPFLSLLGILIDTCSGCVSESVNGCCCASWAALCTSAASELGHTLSATPVEVPMLLAARMLAAADALSLGLTAVEAAAAAVLMVAAAVSASACGAASAAATAEISVGIVAATASGPDSVAVAAAIVVDGGGEAGKGEGGGGSASGIGGGSGSGHMSHERHLQRAQCERANLLEQKEEHIAFFESPLNVVSQASPSGMRRGMAAAACCSAALVASGWSALAEVMAKAPSWPPAGALIEPLELEAGGGDATETRAALFMAPLLLTEMVAAVLLLLALALLSTAPDSSVQPEHTTPAEPRATTRCEASGFTKSGVEPSPRLLRVKDELGCR